VQRVYEFLASHPFADETKDRYRRVLEQLIDLDLSQLTAAGLVAFVCRPEWGNSQRYVALCACRSFVRWLFGVSHPALTARVKRGKTKPQRVLSVDEALRLLASFETFTPAGRRDLAMCALALDTGLRASELCRLRAEDVDLSTRVLRVLAKGGQWRTAIFSPQTAIYIAEWFEVRRPASGVGEAFLSFHPPTVGTALTRDGLKGICMRWGRRIGIRLSPHDLRRTFATLSTIFGAPSRVVQVAGGWSDIGMVEHYTRDLRASEIDDYLPVRRLVHNPQQ